MDRSPSTHLASGSDATLAGPTREARYRVIIMALGYPPTLIGRRAVLLAIRMGVTVPES